MHHFDPICPRSFPIVVSGSESAFWDVLVSAQFSNLCPIIDGSKKIQPIERGMGIVLIRFSLGCMLFSTWRGHLKSEPLNRSEILDWILAQLREFAWDPSTKMKYITQQVVTKNTVYLQHLSKTTKYQSINCETKCFDWWTCWKYSLPSL